MRAMRNKLLNAPAQRRSVRGITGGCEAEACYLGVYAFVGLRLRYKAFHRKVRKGREEDLASGFYSAAGLLRPTLLRMRRTFLGDIERRAATRATFRPSRSQTFGIISSANSSVIC